MQVDGVASDNGTASAKPRQQPKPNRRDDDARCCTPAKSPGCCLSALHRQVHGELHLNT